MRNLTFCFLDVQIKLAVRYWLIFSRAFCSLRGFRKCDCNTRPELNRVKQSTYLLWLFKQRKKTIRFVLELYLSSNHFKTHGFQHLKSRTSKEFIHTAPKNGLQTFQLKCTHLRDGCPTSTNQMLIFNNTAFFVFCC